MDMKLHYDKEDAVRDAELACSGRGDEFDDILNLLLDHADVPGEESRGMAEFIAFSALGDNHLWQDMGLRDRAELSELMRGYFGPLAAKNTSDMKWKKFFYKQICEREGFKLCKSPSCGDCVDFDKCFGPEI
jgi:nitrogen fixation protein NifQ